MARRPRTGGSVATAPEGGRPKSGLRHLLRPLRVLWRALPYLRSRNARSASAAAAMARRHWRADAPPRATSLLRLRRAVTRAAGAVDAALHRALAALHRALAALRRAPSPRRAFIVVRARLRRLLRRACEGQRAETTSPPPQPPKNSAWHFLLPHRRPAPAASSPPPPTPPPPPPPPPTPPPQAPRTYIVDEEEVPQDVVRRFVDYCTRECHPNSTVCHLCVFETKHSPNFTVLTSNVLAHCGKRHANQNKQSIRCNEAGCSVRTRPGRDQALHVYFCHRLPPGWWNQ
ncbi:unnamed protein product [Alopecurus aequalis]